jgi:hypothetical protein
MVQTIKNIKHISIFVLTLFISVIFPEETKSQAILEGGPFLGISWYNGDLNPEKLFYNIHPAFGGFLRYSVNDRIGFKGMFTIGNISGEYPIKNVLLLEKSEQSYQFKRTVSDIAVLLEINFFSFDHPYK